MFRRFENAAVFPKLKLYFYEKFGRTLVICLVTVKIHSEFQHMFCFKISLKFLFFFRFNSFLFAVPEFFFYTFFYNFFLQFFFFTLFFRLFSTSPFFLLLQFSGVDPNFLLMFHSFIGGCL